MLLQNSWIPQPGLRWPRYFFGPGAKKRVTYRATFPTCQKGQREAGAGDGVGRRAEGHGAADVRRGPRAEEPEEHDDVPVPRAALGAAGIVAWAGDCEPGAAPAAGWDTCRASGGVGHVPRQRRGGTCATIPAFLVQAVQSLPKLAFILIFIFSGLMIRHGRRHAKDMTTKDAISSAMMIKTSARAH